VEHYRQAASLAMIRYTRGLSTFLEVLDAQRLYGAQDAFVQSKGALETDLISLYKALGGGWDESDPILAVR